MSSKSEGWRGKKKKKSQNHLKRRFMWPDKRAGPCPDCAPVSHYSANTSHIPHFHLLLRDETHSRRTPSHTLIRPRVISVLGSKQSAVWRREPVQSNVVASATCVGKIKLVFPRMFSLRLHYISSSSFHASSFPPSLVTQTPPPTSTEPLQILLRLADQQRTEASSLNLLVFFFIFNVVGTVDVQLTRGLEKRWAEGFPLVAAVVTTTTGLI